MAVVVEDEEAAREWAVEPRQSRPLVTAPWRQWFAESNIGLVPLRPPQFTRGRRLTLLVGGLYCTRCPGIIRTRLRGIGGVVWVAVSPYMHSAYATAVVVYDPELVHASDIVTAVGPPYTVMVVEDVALTPQPRHELVAGIA